MKNELFDSCIYMGSDEEEYFGNGMLSLVNIVSDDISLVSDISYDDELCRKTVSFDNIPEGATLRYTTDLSIPTSDNGVVYNSQISLVNDTHINYAVFDESNNYLGNIGTLNIEVQYEASDNDFEISDDGVITAYLGNRNDIIIPDTINGIVPVEIGQEVFSDSEVTRVVVPDSVLRILGSFKYCNTLRYIKALGVKRITQAFRECGNLRDINMPNVTNSSGAFFGCGKLKSIDFEESLQKLGSEDFMGTAITHLNLPNATHLNGSRDVFNCSNLISISMPSVTNIVEKEFENCRFLQHIDIPSATRLGGRCFGFTSMLKEFDASNISFLSTQALYRTYFDVFDAPLVTQLLSGYKYIEDSSIKVLRLSGLTGKLAKGCLDYSAVRSIYLDNITSMEGAFDNSPNLRLLSMPKCTNYIDCGTVNIYHGPYQAPIQVLWIPSCTSLKYNCVDLRLLFAPSLTSLDITNVKNANLVLGDKLQSITSTLVDSTKHRIIAPENSYAIDYAKAQEIPYTENESSIEILGNNLSSALFNVDNEIFKLDYLALCDDIDFGYIYDFDTSITDNAQRVSIDNLFTENGKRIPVAYNLLSGADDSDAISIRAYMSVGGVEFYSPIVNSNLDFANDFCLTNHELLKLEVVQNDAFVYVCEDCNTVIGKTPDELIALWSSNVINKPVDADSPIEYKLLNVVSDNYLNAKDYALILQVYNRNYVSSNHS